MNRFITISKNTEGGRTLIPINSILDIWEDREDNGVRLVAVRTNQGVYWVSETLDELLAQLNGTSSPKVTLATITKLVSAFLAWPLPASVRSDDCVTMRGYPHRTGTNLLTAGEAKRMLEYLFAQLES